MAMPPRRACLLALALCVGGAHLVDAKKKRKRRVKGTAAETLSPALLERAQELEGLGRRAEAVDAYGRMIEASGQQSVHPMIAYANLMIGGPRHAEAEHYSAEACALDPQHARAAGIRAQVLLRSRGRGAESVAAAARSVALAPNDVNVGTGYAYACGAAGQYEKGVRAALAATLLLGSQVASESPQKAVLVQLLGSLRKEGGTLSSEALEWALELARRQGQCGAGGGGGWRRADQSARGYPGGCLLGGNAHARPGVGVSCLHQLPRGARCGPHAPRPPHLTRIRRTPAHPACARPPSLPGRPLQGRRSDRSAGGCASRVARQPRGGGAARPRPVQGEAPCGEQRFLRPRGRARAAGREGAFRLGPHHGEHG